jgi:putative ABC transport system permease protein
MHPPRVARFLLGRLLPVEDREHFLGDVDEEFHLMATERSRATATLWYWMQAIRSAPGLLRSRMRRSSTPSPPNAMLLRDLADDLRFAVRRSRVNLLPTLTVVVTMALGIGVTTAVFSVVNGILLRPLPFAESTRVVQLSMVLSDGHPSRSLSYVDMMDFRARVRSFALVAAMQRTSMTLERGAEPRRLRMAQVDASYGSVFAITPLLGRMFVEADMRVGGPPRVMLSYQLWSTVFGGDRSIVGQSIMLDEMPHEVVGVLPPSAFSYPAADVEALTPLVIYPNSGMDSRGSLWAEGVAKLRPGVTIEAARRDLEAAFAEIAAEYPKSKSGMRAALEPLRDVVVGDVRAMLALLAGAVAAALLVACSNIANVLLGQSASRARELAIRTALGGTSRRIHRQVLTEGIVLALCGGTIGVLLAPVATHALAAIYPAGLPRGSEVNVDWRVVFVACGGTLIAGVLAGLPAAGLAVSGDLTARLRNGGRAGSRSRLGRIMMGAQVAASTVLLIEGMLLVRTFIRLNAVDLGFDPRGVVTARVAPPYRRYDTPAKLDQFYAELSRRLTALPGVAVATSSTEVPLAGGSWSETITRADRETVNAPRASLIFADAGYERAVGIPLRAGRAITERDDASAPPVVMIDVALARALFPGENPVGRTIRFGSSKAAWRVVGVIASAMTESLTGESAPTMIVPTRQFPRPWRYVVVRSSLAPTTVIREMATTLHTVDAAVALTEPTTMEDRVAATLAPQRFRASLVVGLGALALMLSLIGVYGVVGYAVTQRTREIGIRIALGETASGVRRAIVSGAVTVAGIGVVIGVSTAFAIGRWIATFLSGVSAYDPAAMSFGALALLGAVAAAAYLPARRASRVDPLVALRAE